MRPFFRRPGAIGDAIDTGMSTASGRLPGRRAHRCATRDPGSISPGYPNFGAGNRLDSFPAD
jgi:hypothetical protein